MGWSFCLERGVYEWGFLRYDGMLYRRGQGTGVQGFFLRVDEGKGMYDVC